MEMNNVILSIIIPVYNLEKYIINTLESIENSKFSFDYEVLIINDGSTDNSSLVISNYIKEHSKIFLINLVNSGVSNARNVGLKKACGEFVTFVDGDDTINGEFFECAIDLLQNNEVDFIQGNYIRIKNGKELSREQWNENETIIDSFDRKIDLFIGKSKIVHNAVWGKIYKRKLISDIWFDKTLKIAEDQKFVFDCLRKSKSVLISNKLAYFYQLRDSSAMGQMSIEKIDNNIQVLNYIKSYIGNDDRIEITLIRNLTSAYNLCLTSKMHIKKKKYLNEIVSKKNIFYKLNFSKKERLVLFLIIYFRVIYDFFKR